MKISESNVQMAATSKKTTAVKVSHTNMNITTTADFLEKNGIAVGDRQRLTGDSSAFTDLSEAAKKALDEAVNQNNEEAKKNYAKNISKQLRQSNKTVAAGYSAFSQKSILKDYRMNLMEKLMQVLTGKKFKLNDLEGFFSRNNQNSGVSLNQSQSTGNENVSMSEGGGGGGGMSLATISFSQISIEYFESESVNFSTSASITTEDGRSMNVEMGLSMSQELYAKLDITSLAAGVYCDPLVINFDAAYAQLSDQKISFDLDCDGTSDQISTLMKGSGYLAVDDGSGEVKDGNQLFGTQSGNGFTDLAKHDGDGNGWIDENDEIWDKLRIWTQDDQGNSQLIGLGELGIGAIYLGNVATNYTLNGESGNENGMLRQTGFFLRENGTAGTVQHVDLKI